MRTRDGAEPARSANEVGVLLKALDVLEQLVARKEAGLTELTQATQANKASVFRILTTLERRGFVVKDGGSRKYRAGPRLVALSSIIVGDVDIVQLARPMLEALQDEFAESVNLACVAGTQIQYLWIVEGTHGLRMSAKAGDRDYLHSTGLGKALLAALEPVQARVLLERSDRPELTPNTLTAVDDLMVELGRIRERGYAVDDEENEIGARCIAASVCGEDGVPIAAISVSGPAARIDGATRGAVARRVVETASVLSGRLDGPTSSPDERSPMSRTKGDNGESRKNRGRARMGASGKASSLE